ncbi:hypothetical protein Tco_0636075 [Tanacetum coccineum]
MRYPDTEDLEPLNGDKFSKDLTEKASFHTPKFVSPKSLYVKYVRTIFPSPPLVRKSTFGFKPGIENNQNVKPRHDAENASPQIIMEYLVKTDNLNITMEEYIRLEEENARRNAIAFNDTLMPEVALSYEPTTSPLNDNKIDFRISFDESEDEDYTFDFADMALPPRDHRHPYLRFEGLKYTDAGYTGEGMLMEHMDAQGQSVFTSRAWRRLFEVRGPLEGVRHRMSWREFILGMGLHTMEEMESIGFGAYWAESARQILDKGDLSAYWVGISSMGDFLGTTPSCTSIRDPMLRLCHRLIACTIARRSHAPKKVTMTILFYLRGMDVGSVNIPYLLARYLRMFASRRKRGAMISGGQFVARLAEHFRLLTEQRL